MKWYVKKKGFYYAVYDENGARAADIRAAGRGARITSKQEAVWKIQRSISDTFKILGQECEYYAHFQPEGRTHSLPLPLKRHLIFKAREETYHIEQRLWLDARIYRGSEEIGDVKRNPSSDIVFTLKEETEKGMFLLIMGLALLMQLEEETRLNSCIR